MKTPCLVCRHCGEDLTEFPELHGICEECNDDRHNPEFHDPDLLARDQEERTG